MSGKQQSFEKGMGRLEEIAGLLDRGQVPLEEAIKLYEEGQQTAAALEKILARAERAVSLAPVETGLPNKETTLKPAPDLDEKELSDHTEPTLF